MSKFTPSAQQQAVLDWVTGGTGSLQLTARAGCGKTSTLMQVVEVIAQRKLGEAVIMAFNKSIAGELKAKLEQAGIDWKTAQAGTVHSFGYSAWRRVAPGAQIDDRKVAKLVEQFAEQDDVLKACGDVVIKLVSLAKQRAIGHLTPVGNEHAWFDIWDHFNLGDDIADPDAYPAERVMEAARRIYCDSLDQCREVIDFDDMILAPLVFRARIWPKDWVMVDEAQDTNPARRALALAMLKPRTGRMIFVGDDRQAIYGFTGADGDAMDQLRHETQATTLGLTVTYRCPKAVVAQAQRLVPDIEAHETAPEGACSVLGKYEDLLALPLDKSDAVLCRNTAPLISTAYRLLAAGTACRVEGREIGSGLAKLAQRWKVKELSALLNKLEDHQERQTAKLMSKGQEDRVAALVDQCDCLRIVISRCQSRGEHAVEDLVRELQTMFGDTKAGERPAVLTLSTIHKSKGREWPRVFLLGRSRYMPSPYARKPWQQQQEANLEYVAITRAQRELVDVPAAG